MQRISAGQKNKPIDVDEDPYEGIQEIPPPRNGLVGHEPKSKRLCKRTAPGTSPQHPIFLDADSDGYAERATVANNQNPSGFGLSSSGNSKAPANSLAAATKASSSSSRSAPTQPIANPRNASQLEASSRFHGLVPPAPSPPRTLMPLSSISHSLLKQEQEFTLSLFEDSEMAMDIDSSELLERMTIKEDDSSSDSFWEWSNSSESELDEDREMNDSINVGGALEAMFANDVTSKNSSTPAHRPYCNTLLKAETSTMRISLLQGKPKRRIWEIPRLETRRYVEAPLTTDYHRLIRPKPGLPSRRTYLPEHNIFNCWLNVPLPRLSTPHFKELRTSASINKIAQSHQFIAVASPAMGGTADPDTSTGPPEVDRYNREGNLIIFRGNKYLMLDGHSRSWPVEEGSLAPSKKYYTVNDVAFDPFRPNRLVSSGNDRSVRVVDLETLGDTFSPRDVYKFEYPKVPYDIAFKPNSSLFAVSCLDGKIYLHKDNNKSVIIAADGRKTRPGFIAWGATSHSPALRNMLFVSTESDDDPVCRHTAFDVERQRGEYELDINDSSDAMALDPQGKMLALVTTGDYSTSHALSLFDVGHSEGKRVAGTGLHLLRPDTRRTTARVPLEFTHAAFSPDGILLALARNDHRTHVYDVRYLSDDPVAELVHPPVERPRANHEEFGITGLHWVEGWNEVRTAQGGLGLVTAGADDCVRLWDVTRATAHHNQSMVLARTETDVVSFCIGDISKNEHRLVVGDGAGEVYIFD